MGAEFIYALVLLSYRAAPLPDERVDALLVATYETAQECIEAKDIINARRETFGVALCVQLQGEVGLGKGRPKVIGPDLIK